MKYYIDTEFLEGTQTKRFLGINYGETKPTIDLISIGIVSEDNREYYAISKDFNLKEAWNRFEWKLKKVDDGIPGAYKKYWIRESVLLPIYLDLLKLANIYGDERNYWSFTYLNLKRLLNWHGKSNEQIAEEVLDFTGQYQDIGGTTDLKPKFYAYYGDYDWIVFCWLFGKMIDLPNGFPMYCIDLKQELDNITNELPKELFRKLECGTCTHNVLEFLEKKGTAFELDFRLKMLKEKHPEYPKQTNEHNALADALWNKQLNEFLNEL